MGMSWQVGFGSFQSPGPGFFPFWLALLVSSLSLLFGLRSLGSDGAWQPLWGPGAWGRPLKAILIMLVYSVAIGQLGFIASSGLLFFSWLTLVEPSSWKRKLLVTGCGMLGIYLFATTLQISLPSGLLL